MHFNIAVFYCRGSLLLTIRPRSKTSTGVSVGARPKVVDEARPPQENQTEVFDGFRQKGDGTEDEGVLDGLRPKVGRPEKAASIRKIAQEIGVPAMYPQERDLLFPICGKITVMRVSCHCKTTIIPSKPL